MERGSPKGEASADESTEAGTDDPAGTASDSSRSVTMEPVGTVESDVVFETRIPYTGNRADMNVALGRADGLSATGVRARFGSHLCEELPGVSVDDGELAAVRNGRVVYGGLTYRGPIIHPFRLGRAAQGLYPEEFGDERSFDRQRVADIVDGEFRP